jgi:hypothetical protein
VKTGRDSSAAPSNTLLPIRPDYPGIQPSLTMRPHQKQGEQSSRGIIEGACTEHDGVWQVGTPQANQAPVAASDTDTRSASRQSMPSLRFFRLSRNLLGMQNSCKQGTGLDSRSRSPRIQLSAIGPSEGLLSHEHQPEPLARKSGATTVHG